MAASLVPPTKSGHPIPTKYAIQFLRNMRPSDLRKMPIRPVRAHPTYEKCPSHLSTCRELFFLILAEFGSFNLAPKHVRKQKMFN